MISYLLFETHRHFLFHLQSTFVPLFPGNFQVCFVGIAVIKLKTGTENIVAFLMWWECVLYWKAGPIRQEHRHISYPLMEKRATDWVQICTTREQTDEASVWQWLSLLLDLGNIVSLHNKQNFCAMWPKTGNNHSIQILSNGDIIRLSDLF